MQNTKAKARPNKAARKARRHPYRLPAGTGPNGDRPIGAPADALPGFGFHLLSKELRTVTLMELAMLQGDSIDGRFPGLFTMVDTEEKQLQCIEDLYRIVKAQPKYASLKEPAWKETTEPVEVILWLLRKLGPFSGGAPWTIDTFLQRGKTRYCFVAWKEFHRQKVGHREEYIPLDFLPMLLKRDKPLHDLFIDLVALVSRENGVPLWNEDGDFSKELRYLVHSGPYSADTLERQRKIYSSGIAHQYLQLIRKRRKVVTHKMLQERLISYEAKSERKRLAVWWIKKGMALASTRQCITKNTFVPNYVKGEPIRPVQQYKFIWSCHKNDAIFSRTLDTMRRRSKDGDFYPVMFSIARPGEVVQPIKHDPFPEDLYEFMQYGVKHFTWRHVDYYYRQAFKMQVTPSEQLDGVTVNIRQQTLLEILV